MSSRGVDRFLTVRCFAGAFRVVPDFFCFFRVPFAMAGLYPPNLLRAQPNICRCYARRAMSNSHEHTFRHDVAAVYALLTDADHLKARSESAGHRNVQVTLEERGDTLEVRIARDIESDIPRFAKKVVDPVNHVVDTLRWRADGSGKSCSYDVAVNKRISISGSQSLRDANGECHFTDRFTAKVSIPLVGSKIASLVEKETQAGVRGDCAFTERALGAS